MLGGHELTFTAQASAITLSSDTTTTTCKRKFTHWCLDGTSLDRADVAGIIVGGCIFVIIVLAAIAFFALRISRRRRV